MSNKCFKNQSKAFILIDIRKCVWLYEKNQSTESAVLQLVDNCEQAVMTADDSWLQLQSMQQSADRSSTQTCNNNQL